LKRVDSAGAAPTHFAVHDCLAVRIDLVHATQYLSQRDMNRVWQSSNRDLVVFAHVYNLYIVAFVEALFEFSRSYLFHIVLPLVGLH
jgi:hypothetical protein